MPGKVTVLSRCVWGREEGRRALEAKRKRIPLLMVYTVLHYSQLTEHMPCDVWCKLERPSKVQCEGKDEEVRLSPLTFQKVLFRQHSG